MVFYIFPPTGQLSLTNVEYFLIKRMTLALKISKSEGNFHTIRDILEEASVVTNCECLIEGSKKDQTSHFLLRLACAVNSEMTEFLMKSECRLFMYRMSCMTEQEIHTAVKPLRKLHSQLQTQFSEHGPRALSSELFQVFSLLQYITAGCSWEEVISAYVSGVHQNVAVPFHYVLNLVARRFVLLKRGLAFVPSSKLPELLKSLFLLLLRHGLSLAKEQIHVVKEDVRIWSLFKKVQWMFRQSQGGLVPNEVTSTHKCEDIDLLSEGFPLCMSGLHKTLRGSHRLRHQARVQYTLFLKEIGLPLHEAIDFWRSEYSKPASASKSEEQNRCAHHWETDGQRYTYSIRHLYGLEGKRVNYRGHCCASLQSYSQGPMDQGGCPFQNNSVTSLQKLLIQEDLKQTAQHKICSLVGMGDYNEACIEYMSAKLRNIVHRDKYQRQGMLMRKRKICGMKRDTDKGCERQRHVSKPWSNNQKSSVTGQFIDNCCEDRNQKSSETGQVLDSCYEDRNQKSSVTGQFIDNCCEEINQKSSEPGQVLDNCCEDRNQMSSVTDQVLDNCSHKTKLENGDVQTKSENRLSVNIDKLNIELGHSECELRSEITQHSNCYKQETCPSLQTKGVTPSQNCYQHDLCPSSQTSRGVTPNQNCYQHETCPSSQTKGVTPSQNCFQQETCPSSQTTGVTPSQNCYQHETCPSSQSPLVREGENIHVQKPLQYFLSYQKLKTRLQTISDSV